jgi:NADH:ubiquinone oxidoreductase subunit H
MTAEERVRDAISATRYGLTIEEAIAATIRAAVLEEREACAKLALRVGPAAKDPDGPWHDIAAAIRGRAGP